ncbi:MAG: 50S ribosomal protein L4 [Mycoplasmoidaceae bacterium]|nr:50S ribosomal protein L4 [Mycoplasmoidaceae bacterium]
MSKLNLINIDGKSVKEISFELPTDKVYNQAMFDQVLAENAGNRQGTHSTLTKAEVRGGGKKPLQQKHSGNARQGSIRNPH